MQQAANTAASTLIERRSIDFIPEAERHGKVFSQFTLWLAANLQITAVITGALAVVLGGDIFWSIVGLLIGQLIGGAVMALHGAQGPRLGLPQMIGSRVQFGMIGAVLPLALACVMYLGFNATGMILSGQALGQLLHASDQTGILIFAAVVMVAATLGYQAIHRLGRFASILGVLAFLYLFVRLLQGEDLAALVAAHTHFDAAAFLTAVSLSASWQIAFTPYVSDYSRYLPSKTSPWRTGLAIGLGSVIGSQIAMSLGVLVAAIGGAAFRGHEVAYFVGLGATGTIAAILFFCVAFGKVTISTLNAYGSFMCFSTIASAFGGQRAIRPLRRWLTILAMVLISVSIAVSAQHSFLPLFKHFLLFLLAFFTPWSAINLVDFYLLSAGRVDVDALGDTRGRYAGIAWTGLIVYLIGIAVQLPFIDSAFYSGPMVARLGGADISWLVGWLVPAGLYYLAGQQRRAVPQAV
ncbi:purine-cytosine permease family protein [Paludibacterium purpuratum]|uniref:NCS1 family nucleobase:cation symporter-1 n=1 Tax=Paludibacterium purpuratum TaxID=1144873 RepID=A0A4R7AYF9_9NEIS|nr:cytosine permease [Paludibacterium purpuratum]TDR71456.1 NCS1 family nucleobase:cation symporter-1 [Paludibacterium purpuratum]